MKTIAEMKQETHLPVLVSNDQGVIIFVNEGFENVFGWQASEIVGQMFDVVIPTSFHDVHHLAFSRFLLTEQSTILNHPLQLKAVTKEGREMDAEHFITAEQHQGQWMFAAILRPLSE